MKTVINKTSKIDNVFRTYEMEVLAGEPSFDVQHKEGSCTFQFDIRKVYWCSRLQSERERVLSLMKKGQMLCDAFCGVGPLSIRAAKKGVKVLANDLNPACYYYLNQNIKLNKINQNMIRTYNLDAREFIRICVNQCKTFKDEEENSYGIPEDIKIDHVYMNLPKDAIEFLDVFIGLFTNTKSEIYSKNSLPIVHVYGFSNSKDPKGELYARIGNAFAMSQPLDESHVIEFSDVRDVSNYKKVYCISLKIPAEVAFK